MLEVVGVDGLVCFDFLWLVGFVFFCCGEFFCEWFFFGIG